MDSPVYISVIITNYNRNTKCIKAIESVLGQSYPHFECIVVDDNSTDNSVELMQQIDDKRFSIIALSQNIGQAAILNKFVPLAKFNWVAFLDSDDYWHPQKLEMQVSQITQTDGEAGLYYTASWIVYPNGMKRIVGATQHTNASHLMKFKNLVGITSRVLVNKQAFINIGGFDTQLPSCKDWDCWTRISEHYQIVPLNIPLVYYEETSDSVSSNINKILLGRELFWKKHFGDNIPNETAIQLYKEFTLFLLSRKFSNQANEYAKKILSIKKSFSSFFLYAATLCPPNILIFLYKIISKFKYVFSPK